MVGERGMFRLTENGLEKIEKPKKIVDAPAVHGDEALDGIHSMADDKVYYSKSAYKKALAEQGYEVTGGDHLKGVGWLDKKYEPDERKIREDAEKAYYDIKYDRVPISEASKQLNIEEERQWKAYQMRQKTNWAK